MEDNKTTEEIKQVVELTAGEMLRNARTTGRRKREIPTIAKQLCIREEFLQALEEGNYTFIPELVYILGFARNYAMELGLNPDEIVAKIKREMGVVSDCSPADNDADACGVGTKSERAKFDIKVVAMRVWEFVVRHRWWFIGAVAALILTCGLVAILLTRQPDVEEAPVDTVVAEETVAEPAFKMPVKERWGNDKDRESGIVLQAVRGSWIKVEDARKRTEFSRVLVEGDIYYVPVKGRYKATFGDAGGIDIWVNGVLAPKAGADHERKQDIELDAEKLLAGPKADKKAEKSDKSEKADKTEKTVKAADGTEYGTAGTDSARSTEE